MRIRSPSSRAGIRIRFSPIDVALAAISPLLALYIRDAYILSADGAILAASYCLVSLFCSLIAFSAFGVAGGIPRYYSVHEVIDLTKVVIIGELMTCIVLFTLTRLEGIPRSTPAIHALILGAGLVTARALAHLADKKRDLTERPHPAGVEHVILIGLSDLSVLYMKFLEAGTRRHQRVIALLDEEPRWAGRSVNGVRVFGPPAQLEALIEEFAVHGIRTDRVVVGGEADILSDEAMTEIRRVCARRELEFVCVPDVFGLSLARQKDSPQVVDPASAPIGDVALAIALPRYFRFKRAIDFCAALLLAAALLPLWLIVAVLAFLDVGSPILFWQQRTGLNGRQFLMYKFRTLQPAFDWRGQKTPEGERLSWIGRLLRKTRLDELPQLLNVLVGDMSLVGPRPLLPHDQPAAPTVRLMVRPGITGWAQVNGGALLLPAEKEALDEWYIRDASPAFDLRIVAVTALSLIRGDRRSAQALAQARGLRGVQIDGQGTSRHDPPLVAEGQPPTVLSA